MRLLSIRLLLLSLLFALGFACSNDDDDDDVTPNDDDVTPNDDDVSNDDDDDDDDTGPPPTTNPPDNSPFAERGEPDQIIVDDRLSGPVEAVRDEFGVPHIYAATMPDAAFVQGYLSAHDRFWGMDAIRHVALGRLTEYAGIVALSFDQEFRGIFMSPDGRSAAEVWYESLDDEIRRIMEIFAEGVNLYLEELRAGLHPLSANYTSPLLAAQEITPDDIPDWRASDTLAVTLFYLYFLSDTSGDEIGMAALLDALPPDLYTDLVRLAPADTTASIPEFFDSEFYQPASDKLAKSLGEDVFENAAAIQSAKNRFAGVDWESVLEARAQRNAMFPLFGKDKGSNNWVIAGQHTASGSPLVANDPHLPFMNPPIWWHHHMDTILYGDPTSEEAGSVIGVAFAGLPAPVLGHNQHVAWGATVTYYDVVDVYVETLNEAGDAVMFEGIWVPIARYEESFKLGSKSDSEVSTAIIEWVPHHGPIIPGSKADGKALTFKWNGQTPTNEADMVLAMFRSKNIDEWMDAAAMWSIGPMNLNAADRDGNTGYYPHAKLPLRETLDPANPPWMPLPGEGGYEWLGWIPDSEVPKSVNRPEGYVVTANADITGNLADNDPLNDPQYNQATAATGYRAGRITDIVEAMIEEGHPFTPQDMIDIQADNYSLEAFRFMPFILSALEADPERTETLGLAEAAARLAAWDLTTPSGVDADYRTDGGPDANEIEQSVATTIFYALLPRLANRIFNDDTQPYGVGGGYSKTKALIYLLENPDASLTGLTTMDDLNTPDVVETWEDNVLAALADALAWLASEDAFESTDMQSWRWGVLHQISIPDMIGFMVPGISFSGLGEFPRGGANYTVDVASHGSSGTSFNYSSGPSMRFVAEMHPEGIVSRCSLPGGQIDDVDSPHYDDLLEMWLRNETFPYYFELEDVLEHVEEYILFGPPNP